MLRLKGQKLLHVYPTPPPTLPTNGKICAHTLPPPLTNPPPPPPSLTNPPPPTHIHTHTKRACTPQSGKLQMPLLRCLHCCDGLHCEWPRRDGRRRLWVCWGCSWQDRLVCWQGGCEASYSHVRRYRRAHRAHQGMSNNMVAQHNFLRTFLQDVMHLAC